MFFGREEDHSMIELVNTTFGLTGDVLDARNGAISMNAVLDSLRAVGRDHQPVLDDDYRKMVMVKKLLNSLHAGYAQESEFGTTVAPQQVPQSKVFNKLEAGLTAALEHLEEIEQAAPATKAKKAA
mgnify:CR=1 FL=1